MLTPVWVNGTAHAAIDPMDRALLYGHGLFETILVKQGRPVLLDAHLARLEKGAKRLNIPLDSSMLRQEIDAFLDSQVVLTETTHTDKTVLRLCLTAGSGGRGYQAPEIIASQRIIALFAYPDYPHSRWEDGIVLGLSEIRLAKQPQLAGIKHNNRLEQVMARADWQPDWHEALMLDTDDKVIEANMSNVFIVRDGELITPDLNECGIEGVMRATLIELAQKQGFDVRVKQIELADISEAEEIFVSNSLIGIWPVRQFQQRRYSHFDVSKRLYKMLVSNDAI